MSSPQVSASGLSSVVRIPSGVGQWEMIDNGDPFAQFHAKFWGKSMAAEEKEWLNTQSPAIASELGDQELDGEGHVDDVRDVPVVAMDVETDKGGTRDNGTDLGDDIIPGCYMLDIGIKGFRRSKIWIRADYIRAFDHLQAHYDAPRIQDTAPAAVITGQPGIGKSVWIYYAVRRCLAERKPVIWYHSGICKLFVEEGVYKIPTDFDHTWIQTFVWTLVDSDQDSKGVPSHLVSPETHLFVIYSTSPQKERWSRLHKTVDETVVIMNPWTRAEIIRLASLFPENITDTGINEIFDELGPIPRLCIDYQLKPKRLANYRWDLHSTIADIEPAKIIGLFQDSTSLSSSSISDKICIISREKKDEVDSHAVVAPITPSIQSRLANQFRNLQQEEQLKLYDHFARVPQSRVAAGQIFEAMAQRKLQDGFDLSLLPMVKLDKAQKGALPQWYSSHMRLNNAKLESYRQKALQEIVGVRIEPSRTEAFPDGGPQAIERDVFYLPEKTNQEALDSFIWPGGDTLYIFQFTVGGSHGIKGGLVRFFDQYEDLPPISSWLFVFIIEPNRTLICPQPWRLTLRALPLRTAVVDVGRIPTMT